VMIELTEEREPPQTIDVHRRSVPDLAAHVKRLLDGARSGAEGSAGGYPRESGWRYDALVWSQQVLEELYVVRTVSHPS
jgi:hypothetical protein